MFAVGIEDCIRVWVCAHHTWAHAHTLCCKDVTMCSYWSCLQQASVSLLILLLILGLEVCTVGSREEKEEGCKVGEKPEAKTHKPELKPPRRDWRTCQFSCSWPGWYGCPAEETGTSFSDISTKSEKEDPGEGGEGRGPDAAPCQSVEAADMWQLWLCPTSFREKGTTWLSLRLFPLNLVQKCLLWFTLIWNIQEGNFRKCSLAVHIRPNKWQIMLKIKFK